MPARLGQCQGFGGDLRRVFYALTRPELLDLLSSAETLLAATGNVVALCPRYGTETPDQAAYHEKNRS
jgi:ArsR family transcriptional regulator